MTLFKGVARMGSPRACGAVRPAARAKKQDARSIADGQTPASEPEAPSCAVDRVDIEVSRRAKALEAWLDRGSLDARSDSADAEIRALFDDLRPGQRTDLLFLGCANLASRRTLAKRLGLEASLDVAGIRDHAPPVEPRFVTVRTSGRTALDAVDWSPDRAARWIAHRLARRQTRAVLDLIFALPVDARRAVAAAYEKSDGPVDIETCRLRLDLADRLSGRDRLLALASWDNASGRLEAHDELALFWLRVPSHRQVIDRLAALSPFEQKLVDDAFRGIQEASERRPASGPLTEQDAVRHRIAKAKAELYPPHLGAFTESRGMYLRPALRSAAQLALNAPRELDNRASERETDARALNRALLGGTSRLKPNRKDALLLLEGFAFLDPEGLSGIRATYDARYGEGRLAADMERLRSARTARWGQRLDEIVRGGTTGSTEKRQDAAARYVALTARQVIEGTVSDRDLLNTLTLLMKGSGSIVEGQVPLFAIEEHYRLVSEDGAEPKSTGNLSHDMRAATRPTASSKALLDVLLGGRALDRPDATAVKVHDTLHNDDGRWRLGERLGKARRQEEVLELLDRRELPVEEQVAHLRATESAYEQRYGDAASLVSRLREDVLSVLGATTAGGAPSSIARLFEQGALLPGDRIYHALHDRAAVPTGEPPRGGLMRGVGRALPRKIFGLGQPNVAMARAEYNRLDLTARASALERYAENRRAAQASVVMERASPELGQAMLVDMLATRKSHLARDLLAQVDIDLASLSIEGEEGLRKLCAKLGVRMDLHRGAALSRFLMDLFGPQGKALDDLARGLHADFERFLAHPPSDERSAEESTRHLAESTRRLVEAMDRYCDRKEKTAKNARLTMAAIIAISLFSAKTFGGASIPLMLSPVLSGAVAAVLSGVRWALLGPGYGRSDLATDLRTSAAYVILAQMNPKLPLSVGAARLAWRIGASQLPARPPRIDPAVWSRLPARPTEE